VRDIVEHGVEIGALAEDVSGLARQALVVSSHGMTFTNATAAVSVLLNALVVEIASRHRGESVEALSRINSILREKSYLVDE